MPTLLCPTCFSGFGDDGCVCGVSEPAIALPAGDQVVMLHVRSPLAAMSPWQLLDTAGCDGPRIYPEHVPATGRLAGRRHRGASIWLAQATWSEIPTTDRAPEELLWVQRVLAQTSRFLLDLPDPGDRFYAAAARTGLREPPAPRAWLQNLLAFLDIWRLRPQAIAVVAPGGAAANDHLAMLRSLCPSVQQFTTHEEAAGWLVGRPVVRSASPDGRPLVVNESAPPRSPRGAERTIWITDVGGPVVSTWLHDLRARQPPAPVRQEPSSHVAVRLLSRMWTSVERRWPIIAGTRLELVGNPARADSVKGRWRSGSVDQRFHLRYHAPTDLGSVPEIVGVGPLSFFGARDLATLLQLVAARGATPRVIVRNRTSDAQLMKWIQSELPGAMTVTLPRKQPQRLLPYLLEEKQ